MLTIVRRALLAAAILAGVWAAALTMAGGFTTTVLGITLRSNNPQRVLVIAFVLLVGYVVSGGRIPTVALRRFAAGVSGFVAVVARRPHLAAVTIALAFTALALSESTRIAGGADAYGYVSQAELFLAGDLVIEQPWAAEAPWPYADWSFSPLGYRPAEPRGSGAIVPTYAPGLPLLLAAAKGVGGQCALFAVVPLLGGLAVLGTYGLGRRLVSPWGGVMAAWFVGTSPAVLAVSFEALSDVPAMAAWVIACWVVITLPPRALPALGAGTVTAVAILIRPNLVPLAVPLGAWYLVRRGAAGESRLMPALLFALGILPAIVGTAMLNDRFFGSPLASGYGSLRELYAVTYVPTNLRRYFGWLLETQTPAALAGFVALFVPSRRVWPAMPDRRILGVVAAFVALLWGQYMAYEPWGHWGFLRFLLPSWPLIMLGLSAVLMAIHRHLTSTRLTRMATPAIAVAAIALGLWTFARAARGDVFGQWRGAAHEAPLGQLIRAHTSENSVVLTWQRSGTIRYYSGRTTLRYDFIEGDWLDRAVEWLGERGVHVYAVLGPDEISEYRRRFPGQAALAALTQPIFIYEPARTALYDLTTPPDRSQSLVLYAVDPGGRVACDPPATPSPIALRSRE